MRPRNGSGSGNGRGQADRPIFSVGARLCICNVGRRVETSAVDGRRWGREGGLDVTNRDRHGRLRRGRNIGISIQLHFMRHSRNGPLAFSVRPPVRPPSGDCGSATGLCCDRRPLKSQVQPTSLYLTWRFARPTLYPSVSVRKMDEGLTELRRRTSEPIWRERGRERHARTTRISRDR